MHAATGFKAHSGWAALVVLGEGPSGLEVILRRRVDLVDPDEPWAKQPYHAAEGLPAEAAQKLVQRGAEEACRIAQGQALALRAELEAAGHELTGAAVLVGRPLPPWTTAQILAVHVRMHQAEGALFPTALIEALRGAGVPVLETPEAGLDPSRAATLGASAGPPWGRDQKLAALAAMMVLRQPPRERMR
jgi:hypothetical protein